MSYRSHIKHFMKIVCGINIILKRFMGGRNHSLNLIGSGQGQRPPIFFYTTYRFLKTICIYIGFIYWKPKNNTLSPHWCWPRYVEHGWCIMPTPQPLFPNYHLPYSLGGVKISSPHMRPLSRSSIWVRSTK